MKASGNGRELGPTGLAEYQEPSTSGTTPRRSRCGGSRADRVGVRPEADTQDSRSEPGQRRPRGVRLQARPWIAASASSPASRRGSATSRSSPARSSSSTSASAPAGRRTGGRGRWSSSASSWWRSVRRAGRALSGGGFGLQLDEAARQPRHGVAGGLDDAHRLDRDDLRGGAGLPAGAAADLVRLPARRRAPRTPATRRSTPRSSAAILIVFTTVINAIGVKLMARINSAGVFIELVAAVLIIILLAINIVNPPHGAVRHRGLRRGIQLGYFGAFLVAALASAYVMYGFDTASSLGEETVDPRRTAPTAILRAVIASFVIGGLILLFAHPRRARSAAIRPRHQSRRLPADPAAGARWPGRHGLPDRGRRSRSPSALSRCTRRRSGSCSRWPGTTRCRPERCWPRSTRCARRRSSRRSSSACSRSILVVNVG